LDSFLVNYFGLPEIAGFSAKTAQGFVSFYWAADDRNASWRTSLRRFKDEYLLACAQSAQRRDHCFHDSGRHTAMWTFSPLFI